jgi:hypothetical protein
MPIKLIPNQSGYYLTADISDIASSEIPDYYFGKGNYEDDSSTAVKQRIFDEGPPFDFSFCRWLAMDKGLAFQPYNNHYMNRSTQSLMRISICKSPEFFKDPSLI